MRILTCLCLFLCLPAYAADYAALAESSLVKARIQLVRHGVYRMLNADQGLPPEVKMSILKRFDTSFSQDSITIEFAQKAEFDLSEDDVEYLQHYSESELGQKTIGAEGGAKLLLEPVILPANEMRSMRARQIDLQIGLSQMQINFLQSLHKLVGVALSQQMGNSPYVGLVNGLLSDLIMASRSVIQNGSENLLLNLYLPLNVIELNEYTAAMNDPAFSRFNALMQNVLSDALVASVVYIGQGMLENTPKK